MRRIKFFQILACATLFSTASSVNAFAIHPGGYGPVDPSSSGAKQRVTSRTPADGILLGDSAAMRDGVVLGDESIFRNGVSHFSGISRFAGVKQEPKRSELEGVVLGDEFVWME